MNNKQAEIKDCASCQNRHNCDIQIQHIIKHGCRLLKRSESGFPEWIERMEYYYAACNGIMLIGRCAGVSFEEFAKTYADVYRLLNDDWSLKGKEHYGWIRVVDDLETESASLNNDGSIGINYVINKSHYIKDKKPSFRKEVIETLRQKLIEIIYNWIQDGNRNPTRKHIEEMLNKPFGVIPKQDDAMNTME
jgi:hypothetical protein